MYVAATVGLLSVDLCMFDRSERRILDRSLDVKGLHWTWRDGEKPHLRSESGDLADTTIHPELVEGIREIWGNARLWAAGWQRRWDEVHDVRQTGSRIYHADDLSNFPPAKRRERVIRVDLRPGEHVEVAHYLVRPGQAAEDFLAEQWGDPNVQLMCVDAWSPWSIVTAWRFDDRSFLRALGPEAVSS